MSKVVLYDYWRSSAAYRVRIALNLKGVDYRSVTIDLAGGDQLTEDYHAKNPQNLVPMLEIDGHRLTQSLAIIDYLDANYPDPPMVSADPAERARTLAQALTIAADVHPLQNLRVLKYLRGPMGQDDDAVSAFVRNWQHLGLAALEEQAPEQGFFGGERPNLTDVVLVPQMYGARRFELPLDDLPRLVRIDAALRDLPAFAAAAPDAVKPA